MSQYGLFQAVVRVCSLNARALVHLSAYNLVPFVTLTHCDLLLFLVFVIQLG